MFAVAVLAPLLLLLVALGVVLVVAAVRPQRTPGGALGPRLSRVRRRTARWRWGGVALGVVLAGGAIHVEGALGRGLILAAPLFALGVLAGVLVGELRVAAPEATTRSASLQVRQVSDYLPRGLTMAVMLAAATLAALLAITTILGSPDDLGRQGRQLIQVCSDAMTQGRGPWPGSFYSIPLATIALGGVMAASLTLHRVVRRPRQGEDVGVDDTLRRSAAAAVVAATGILITVPLAGVSAMAAIALLGITCPPWWMNVLGWTCVVLVPLAAALAVWCAAVLLMPAPGEINHQD